MIMSSLVLTDMGVAQRLSLTTANLLPAHLFQPPSHHVALLQPINKELTTDSNNNASGENENSEQSEKKDEKYSLRPRSIQKRIEVEQKVRAPSGRSKKSGGGSKQKPKPPPLSKYRRKTANARERDRMREINAAFEALRRAVPPLNTDNYPPSSPGGEKLTKITTLRLAMKYISALSDALKDNQDPCFMFGSGSSATSSELGDFLSDCGDLDSLLLESDGESLHLSDHSLTPADFGSSLGPADFMDHSLTPPDFCDPFSDSCLTP